MRRLLLVSSLLVFAAISANCAGNGSSDQSASSPLAPSALDARTGGGKGGGGTTTGGSGSVSLVMVTDNNGDGLPNWGDTITFQVSTTATSVPYVNLACYQNSVLVASASAGYFDAYPWPGARLVTLNSRTWTSGAADCTANMGYYNNKGNFVTVSSLAFHVAP